MCHNRSRHVPACEGCLGERRQPCCHAPRGSAELRTEPRVPGNTCPYSSDSAERGRYLENCAAERAMSDARKQTWHLLPYGRRKKVPCDLGFSECWYHDTLGKLLDLLMHQRYAPHEHMCWLTLFR